MTLFDNLFSKKISKKEAISWCRANGFIWSRDLHLGLASAFDNVQKMTNDEFDYPILKRARVSFDDNLLEVSEVCWKNVERLVRCGGDDELMTSAGLMLAIRNERDTVVGLRHCDSGFVYRRPESKMPEFIVLGDNDASRVNDSRKKSNSGKRDIRRAA